MHWAAGGPIARIGRRGEGVSSLEKAPPSGGRGCEHVGLGAAAARPLTAKTRLTAHRRHQTNTQLVERARSFPSRPVSSRPVSWSRWQSAATTRTRRGGHSHRRRLVCEKCGRPRVGRGVVASPLMLLQGWCSRAGGGGGGPSMAEECRSLRPAATDFSIAAIMARRDRHARRTREEDHYNMHGERTLRTFSTTALFARFVVVCVFAVFRFFLNCQKIFVHFSGSIVWKKILIGFGEK